MKRLTVRSVIFTLYSLILAILVTAYMEDKIYFLNFYIIPILFAAYYYNIPGAIVFILISSGLSVFFMHSAGSPIWDTPMVSQIFIFFIVGIVAGIFQRENDKLNNYLLMASLTDRLTGLYNYGYFIKRIKEEIARADRHKHPLSLIMMDIDHFKQYNDIYGHQKGNEVLITISKILTENIRQSEVAFRYGGEEFCIILPETKDEAMVVAEKIRKRVEGEKFLGDVRITISAGISYYPYPDETIGLVERADRALYEAKELGRNRVCIYGG